MSSVDLIRMGIKSLWRRKLRTFLTILGVIIGTSSIIVMLSLGFGMSEAFKQQVSQMGSLNIITINQGYYDRYNPSPSAGRKKQEALNDEAVRKFKAMEGVNAVTPVVETNIKVIDGKYSGYVPVRGIDPNTMEDFDYKLADGRLLKSGDEMNIVFGGGIKHMFYNENQSNRYGPYKESNIDVMKDKLVMTFDMSYGQKSRGPQVPGGNEKKPNYKLYKIKTVGLLQEGDWEKDSYAFMPIEQVQKLVKEKNKAEGNKMNPQERNRQKGYQTIFVKVNDINKVQEVQTKIKDMGYNAYSLSDYLESMKKTSNIIQAVLGGIGAVSLLVAAIGITNTMVMSIYERTKEIGIMKVIGASLKDIKRLFLFEAGMIGLLGGIIGIALSEILSLIINKLGANFGNYMIGGGETHISIIPIWLIFAAMGFTTIVGLVSGFYPAKRAMNLSALEAIRTE